jgi:hypothetical protein
MMFFFLDGIGKSSVAGCLCSTLYGWPCIYSAKMHRWYNAHDMSVLGQMLFEEIHLF